MISQHESEYETMFMLMEGRDWEGLRILLALESCLRLARDEKTGNNSINERENDLRGVLHYACQFNPPLDVVRTITRLCPDDARMVDKNGRYPLHIAAECGVSCRVITFLLNKFTPAAGKRDISGKTPLHSYCEHLPSMFKPETKDNGSSRTNESSVDVLLLFSRMAPESIHQEDFKGMTALEYAMESDADPIILHTLMKIGQWSRKRPCYARGKTNETSEKQFPKENSRRRRGSIGKITEDKKCQEFASRRRTGRRMSAGAKTA